MLRVTLLNHIRDWRTLCLPIGCVGVLSLGGCSGLFQPQVEPYHGGWGVNRRMQLWEVAAPAGPVGPATTQPAAAERPASQPADTSDPQVQPYRLNTENIVKLFFHKGPLVAASREEMIAAQHGLDEFKANLSRFEPFARFDADTSRFPERRDSEGLNGEAAVGIEKETFDGAVIRLEGGLSGQRVRFGDVEEDEEDVEEGSGGLIRARIEVPFVGSRKRQDRVISAAFQESTARGAVLRYLSNYRSYARAALNYYDGTLMYLNYSRAYEEKIDTLQELLDDPRVKPEDRLRIQSSAGDAKVLRDQYQAYYQSYLLSLLEYLGIEPGEEYILEERAPDDPSRYYERTRTPEQREQLLAEAYDNNPQFRVLNDAIQDAQLKRSQAILGEHDITAFMEGTQFSFGSETYDDRVGGWTVGGGVSFRLNDQRVLTASRKKAEAEIRQFQAEIEAEQLSVQRQVAVQSATLSSHVDSRPQILENIDKARREFEERRKAYLNGESSSLTIDDVLTSLSALTTGGIRLAANLDYSAAAENALMAATGEVYRLVGMKMADHGNGVELPETK